MSTDIGAIGSFFSASARRRADRFPKDTAGLHRRTRRAPTRPLWASVPRPSAECIRLVPGDTDHRMVLIAPRPSDQPARSAGWSLRQIRPAGDQTASVDHPPRSKVSNRAVLTSTASMAKALRRTVACGCSSGARAPSNKLTGRNSDRIGGAAAKRMSQAENIACHDTDQRGGRTVRSHSRIALVLSLGCGNTDAPAPKPAPAAQAARTPDNSTAASAPAPSSPHRPRDPRALALPCRIRRAFPLS